MKMSTLKQVLLHVAPICLAANYASLTVIVCVNHVLPLDNYISGPIGIPIYSSLT